MGIAEFTLAHTAPDGSDRPVPHVDRVDPLRIIATMAACIDTAQAMSETGDIDPCDVDDTARLIGYRILTRAQRETREPHTWWHGHVTSGDADPVSPAPDGYERVRAQRRTTRTNKGETVELVTVHGRAYVQGSQSRRDPLWQGPTLPGQCAMSADRMARALETVPRATSGYDAVSLYRMTQALYPDVPRLIGGDVLTFHEWHTWDEVRAATPRKGHGTRYRLTTIHPRKTERATTVTFADGQSLTRLLAPSADPSTAWHGHTLYVRPATVRDQRKARRRIYRAVKVKRGADIARRLAALADVAPVGSRIAWTSEHHAGTLTVTGTARARRYSVTGLPSPVRGQRSADGLAGAIARAIA